MDLETRQARINAARSHTTAWSGDTTTVEVSISSKTAKEFTYEESDSQHLFRKEKDGQTLDGWFLHNNNCPKIEDIDEAQLLAEELGIDLVKLIQAKITTEFQNSVRSHLNRKGDSKKALKQQQASEIKERMLAGDLTPEDALAQIASLL